MFFADRLGTTLYISAHGALHVFVQSGTQEIFFRSAIETGATRARAPRLFRSNDHTSVARHRIYIS